MRATHEARHRCVHNATGRLARNTPLSAFFAEVVCDVGTTPSRTMTSPSRTMTSPSRTATSPSQTATSPSQTATSPPANGGNCTIRGATRRRHAEGRLLMLQNPHHFPSRVRLRHPRAQGPGGSSMVTPDIGRAAPMSATARPRRPLTRSRGSHTQARDAEFAGTRHTPPTKTPTFPHQQAEKSLQNQHVLSFNPTVTAGGYWLGYQKPARALRPWPVNLSYMK